MKNTNSKVKWQGVGMANTTQLTSMFPRARRWAPVAVAGTWAGYSGRHRTCCRLLADIGNWLC